ncbi:DUF188 domain-containing protein [Paenibacillus sp. FSL R5-0490]|nr:DUF188 domain-containing protein [Paenibacillus sp. FSL R5-0490]
MANSFTVDAVIVASYAHMQNDLNGAVWKFVDSTKEAADLFIMNNVKSGDAVVTQDIGLESTLLLKGVYVLSPRGILFEESEIRTPLEMMHLSAKALRRGVYGKGPKPLRQEDRSRFVQQLTKILSNFEGIQ